MTNESANPYVQINIRMSGHEDDMLREVLEYGFSKYRAELLDGYKDEVKGLDSMDMDDYVDLTGNFKDLLDQLDGLQRSVQSQLG